MKDFGTEEKMNLTLRIFFGIVDLIFLLVILNMLKKKRLNLKYTLTWLFAALALLVVDCFPQIIDGIMELVGVASPVSMVFVLEALFVLVILLSLTAIVSRLTEQVYRLTQTIAIMEKKIRELEEGKNGKE